MAIDSSILLATEEDWETESSSLTLAVKMVSTVEEAIHHINTYGICILKQLLLKTRKTISKFFTSVDAAALYHNASTRFRYGSNLDRSGNWYQYTKATCKRTNGASALTSTKYVIRGNGRIQNNNKRHSIGLVSFIIKINYHTNSPTSIALNKRNSHPANKKLPNILLMTA